MKDPKGRLIVFTGEGKGKTTGALGRAWRLLEQGGNVFMVQFMKPARSSGEHFAAEIYGPRMILRSLGQKGFIIQRTGKPLDRIMAHFALKEAKAALEYGACDLAILDEANMAVYMKLIALNELLEIVDARPAHVELILTGRYAHPEVLARADMVCEYRCVKHYYQKGVRSRAGIEY